MTEVQVGAAKSPGVQLLEFQRKLQGCKSLREFNFVAVNESFGALEFDQAVIWEFDSRGGIEVAAVSGLAEVTSDTPYVQWLVGAIKYILSSSGDPVVSLPFDSLPADLAGAGRDWVHDHLLHCILRGPDNTILGGMFFNRQTSFNENELAVSTWMADATGFALWAWKRDSQKINQVTRVLGQRPVQWAVGVLVVALLLLAFVPIRLSALVPAEITPIRPVPITSPIDGVVGKIIVQPNQIVKADEAVVELDDTSIRNRLAVATKAFETATADYQRAVNKSFNDEPSKGELLVLGSRVKEKSAEVAYLSELLERLRIMAPQGGIAIFSDAEELRGRPVQTGERIMMIADPSLVGVTVYLPPDDAVELDIGGEVTVYLNIAPLSPLKARIVQTSYEAAVQPDNTVAYIIKAALEEGSTLPRIGNKGTAKVYGKTVSLGYYLFRKPILFLRRSLGV